MKRILITGAGGQIGSWLVPRLRELYGDASVVATDVRDLGIEVTEAGPFERLDATDANARFCAALSLTGDLNGCGHATTREIWIGMRPLHSPPYECFRKSLVTIAFN